MITTRQLASRLELLEIAGFVHKGLGKIYDDCISPQDLQTEFDIMREAVYNPQAAIWVQSKGKTPILMIMTNILTDLRGVKTCWISNVYSLPGVQGRSVMECSIIPWAKAQGATRLQCSERGTSLRSQAREICFKRYKLEKVFSVYERKI